MVPILGVRPIEPFQRGSCRGFEQDLAILQEFLIPGILLGYIEEKKFLKLTQFLFPFSLNPYRQGGETDHCIKRVL